MTTQTPKAPPVTAGGRPYPKVTTGPYRPAFWLARWVYLFRGWLARLIAPGDVKLVNRYWFDAAKEQVMRAKAFTDQSGHLTSRAFKAGQKLRAGFRRGFAAILAADYNYPAPDGDISRIVMAEGMANTFEAAHIQNLRALAARQADAPVVQLAPDAPKAATA